MRCWCALRPEIKSIAYNPQRLPTFVYREPLHLPKLELRSSRRDKYYETLTIARNPAFLPEKGR